MRLRMHRKKPFVSKQSFFYSITLLDLAFVGRLLGTQTEIVADQPSTLSTKQLLLKIKKRFLLARTTQKTFPLRRRRARLFSLKKPRT